MLCKSCDGTHTLRCSGKIGLRTVIRDRSQNSQTLFSQNQTTLEGCEVSVDEAQNRVEQEKLSCYTFLVCCTAVCWKSFMFKHKVVLDSASVDAAPLELL